MLNLITWTIKLTGCFVGLLVWFTIGILISVIKVFRVMVAFSIKATLQAFKDQDMRPIERSIHTALMFWPSGVVRILKILRTDGNAESEEIVSLSKVFFSLASDIIYLAFFCIPVFAYYWLTVNSPCAFYELVTPFLESLDAALHSKIGVLP